MGGKFGEMSTLMNYTFQSFNFRGKEKYRPFYDLICNIAAEEYSHIEAVAATINLLLSGATPRVDRSKTRCRQPAARERKKPAAKPAKAAKREKRNPAPLSEPRVNTFYPYHFSPPRRRHCRSMASGNPWNGSYVTATGNLKMDLLHNFFLECGARAGQDAGLRDDCRSDGACDGRLPARARRRAHCGVRQGAGKANGRRCGPIAADPDVSNKKFPEAMKLEAEGLHTIMWHWSQSDYTPARRDLEWPSPRGRPGTRSARRNPPGFPWPDLPEEPQLSRRAKSTGHARTLREEIDLAGCF